MIKKEEKQELSNYLESLAYEIERTKEIVAYMLTHNQNTDTETFKLWEKENQKVFTMYQIAKSNLEKDIIKGLCGKKLIGWGVDFQTQILTVEFDDDKKD